MAFLVLGANSVSGYTVKNSLRFNSGSSDYLNRTPASAGNRTTWTYSAWIKRSNLSSGQTILSAQSTTTANLFYFYFSSSDKLTFYHYSSSGGVTDSYIDTTQLFRDTSAWYHIVLAVDTTQATASNRTRIYVNGSEVTSFSTSAYFSQNYSTYINSTNQHRLGVNPDNGQYFNGYQSEVYLIDGSQLTPSSFGETDTDTGIWKPKAYTGTYGTNGFYLKFANSASLGTDSSGNGNTFTVNNLTSVDQSTDTPTNNFCTLNPLDTVATNAPTFSNGNLTVSTSSTGASPCRSTFSVDKGKWYWEIKKTSASSADTIIGIMEQSEAFNTYIGSTAKGYGYISTGIRVNNTSQVSYGATYTSGDIIGVALDMDNGTLIFYKNGSSQGTAYSSLSGLFSPAHSDGGTGTETADCNFGNPPYSGGSFTDSAGRGNFSYSVPSGFYALCTANLSTQG
jgi:hypothetical protein